MSEVFSAYKRLTFVQEETTEMMAGQRRAVDGMTGDSSIESVTDLRQFTYHQQQDSSAVSSYFSNSNPHTRSSTLSDLSGRANHHTLNAILLDSGANANASHSGVIAGRPSPPTPPYLLSSSSTSMYAGGVAGPPPPPPPPPPLAHHQV